MAAIPNRAVFRSQEVCEIAEVQPYVLRSWEAEFPDLGLSKGTGTPRVYRRGDVERVLRIKQLVFDEGLTLAGARRQLSEEDPSAEPIVDEDIVPDAEVAKLLDREVLNGLRDVKTGLHWILGVLNGGGAGKGSIRLVSRPSHKRPVKKSAKSARPGKTVRSKSAARAVKKATKKRRR